MSITASVVLSDSAQKDGRRWIIEQHTDNIGLKYLIFYLCAAGFDKAAALAARAIQLASDIQNGEIANNIAQVLANGSLAVTTTSYSTNNQNLAALRTAYQTTTKLDAIMIGDFLSALTDVQLQAIFSMTAGQVTTLRTNKLTSAANTATAIRAAAGQ